MYQKRLLMQADVHSDTQLKKQKVVSQRNVVSRDRGILVVNFGHIIHFQASERQKIAINLPKKVYKADYHN